MFSYFINGIEKIKPYKTIDFADYVSYIKSTDFLELLTEIQKARHDGQDEKCSNLKKRLPYFTPHCVVKSRNLKTQENINKNFVLFSGYMYFDIDEFPSQFTVSEYKHHLTKKLEKQASLISYSASKRGLCVIFKVKNEITFENFNDLRSAIIKKYLSEEKIDSNASGILRVQYLPHDLDVFVSYENSIHLELECPKKLWNECNSERRENNILNPDFSKTNDVGYKVYDINEVLDKLILKTIVPVVNINVDFKEVDVVIPYVPRVIPDTKKHKTYYILIHQLYHLNPDIEVDYIFSYIFYVNNICAKPKMEPYKLIKHFKNVIEQIKETGIVHAKPKVKRVHFNKSSKLSSAEKNIIAKQLNSTYRKKITIDKINIAIEQLKHDGIKITQRAISKITGLNVCTIKQRMGNEKIDMDYEVSLWN